MQDTIDWLIAPDSFKGTYTAREVAVAIAAGVERIDRSAVARVCPLADGGEGTLETLLDALGGDIVQVAVHDPLSRPIGAPLGLTHEGALAIVETASASGLCLVAASDRDAETASTFGTGELIAAAVDTGAVHVVVGAGGSASTDGGAGALRAIEAAGGLRGARVTVLADVTTPFERAAEVFGPQKGADAKTVIRLTQRLQGYASELPRDPRGIAMSGAAGGLAGALWARYDAQLVRGAGWVLDAIGFNGQLLKARAVITGEGRLDALTLEGKLISEIARRCAEAGVPLHAVVGSVALTATESAELGLASVREASGSLELEHAGSALASMARAT